jgi:hypothetical protein
MPCRTAACSQNTDLPHASFVQVTASIRIPGSRNFGLRRACQAIKTLAAQIRVICAPRAGPDKAITCNWGAPGAQAIRVCRK